MNSFTRTILLLLAAMPAILLGSVDDRRIEEVGRASYNYQTVLNRRVSIESRNGVVTLSGLVEDMEDELLAVETVEHLPGISRINNEIMIQWSVPRLSDAWVALKLRRRLLLTANVSVATINIEVRDGIVTLTGTTASAAQKELAAASAQEMEFVKSVVNELMVAESTGASSTIGEVIDDGSIRAQVKCMLQPNRENRRAGNGAKTAVEVKDGVVVLTGEVATAEEKVLVTKRVKDMRGVKSVDNQMTVKA